MASSFFPVVRSVLREDNASTTAKVQNNATFLANFHADYQQLALNISKHES
ncbi:hypothetical protein [Hymenobacter coalescens]